MAHWPHVASTCSGGFGETEICGNWATWTVLARTGRESILYTGDAKRKKKKKKKMMCDIDPSEVCPGGGQT